jgi:hypothetical protein
VCLLVSLDQEEALACHRWIGRAKAARAVIARFPGGVKVPCAVSLRRLGSSSTRLPPRVGLIVMLIVPAAAKVPVPVAISIG